MRAEVEVSAAAPALDFIAKAAKSGAAIPILGTMRVEMKGGALRLDGTNLERWATASVPASGDDGAVAVNAEALARFFRAAPKGAVAQIAMEGASLTVSAGRARATLSTLDAFNFPLSPAKRPDAQEIDPDAFCAALALANLGAPSNDPKYYLNGVYLNDDYAVATDGKLMVVCGLPNRCKAIIPREFIPEICALLKGGGAFGADDNHWFARAGGMEMLGKCIAGEYPDWARVDAGLKSDPVALFGKDQITSALALATLGTRCDLRIEGAGDKLTITTAPSDRRWESRQETSVEVEAEVKRDFVCGVAGGYLQSALQAMPDAELAMTVQGEGLVRIEPANGSAFLSRRANIAQVRIAGRKAEAA